MPLPPRFAWTVTEVATRWGCMPADIVGWAMAGHLELVSSIRTVSASGIEVDGLVGVPPADLMLMFRRDGSGPNSTVVRRIRPNESGGAWLRITDPEQGIEIEAVDVMIAGAEMERFEDAHALTKRVAPGGSASKYDWDGFYTALIRRVHNDGLPDTQRELVSEMQGWFERRSKDGDAPDESTIRRKISTLWNELRAA